MAHVHAALIQQFAKDAMEYDDPAKLWEFSMDGGETWESFCDDHNPAFRAGCLYRRKQETININGHKVTKPLRIDELNKDTLCYYTPYLMDNIDYYVCLNFHHPNLHILASKGLLHKTKEAAIEHTKALLSFTEQKND
jgi:hypothetical protein